MTEIETLRARIEALAHATAVLLASRLQGLDPALAAQACAVFAAPFSQQRQAIDPDRQGVMLDTLEDIADRALMLARPGR